MWQHCQLAGAGGAAVRSGAMQPLGLQTGSMALLGSVLQKNETLRAAVITRLTAQFPTLTFPEPVGDAADGAAVMAENS